MANMEHVQLVKRGRDHVARWREANPDDTLDLNAAYMSYVRAVSYTHLTLPTKA